MRRRRRLTAMLAIAVLAVTFALVRARRRAADVPLSPLAGGRFVGPDYLERRRAPGDERPVGEMDDFGVYARDGFDPAAVHPEIRRFYERTAEYEMRYRVRWHRGFRLGAAAASGATSRIEQLNLPGPGDESWHELESRFVDVDPAVDPRPDARAWTRTDPKTGEAVFVAAYATHARDGETFNNIAVPLPCGNLSTVLRMAALDDDSAGVELTTRAPGDPGLYLRTPAGAFALPMDQRFRVWPGDAPSAPDVGREAALVAAHEMWMFGRQFLTIEYAIDRRERVR